MGERASEFRDTLLELIEASPAPNDHPSPEQWLAYHRGELPAGEEERFQEHLVRCRDCFDLAEAAASFAAPDEAPVAGQDVDSAALWRLLRPQLDPSLKNVREISAGPRRRSRWKGNLPTALAASFFVALVGLSAWSFHLESALEASRAPRPNAAIADLSAGERLSTPASAEKTLSASTGLLVLHPAEERPVYRLALFEVATGKGLWSYMLRPDEDLALTIQFPEGIRPGHYRLELSDGAGRRLETHLLHVIEKSRGG